MSTCVHDDWDCSISRSPFGHVGQADENARLVAAADVALVPDAQRGGFGVESERPAHIDRTGGTQNFAERSDENVSGGFLDDDIGGLQLRAVLSGRAGTGIVLPGGDVVVRPDRGGTGVARSPELLSALGVRIPRVARLVPLFEAGVRNLDTGGGRGRLDRTALRIVFEQLAFVRLTRFEIRGPGRVGIAVAAFLRGDRGP